MMVSRLGLPQMDQLPGGLDGFIAEYGSSKDGGSSITFPAFVAQTEYSLLVCDSQKHLYLILQLSNDGLIDYC